MSEYLGGTYLPIDCPSCGRLRLWAEMDGSGEIVVACESCGANDWDCDEKEHERGGPHPQHAVGYAKDPLIDDGPQPYLASTYEAQPDKPQNRRNSRANDSDSMASE